MDLGDRLVMAQLAEDGAGVGADLFELALDLSVRSIRHQLGQALIGVVDFLVARHLAQCVDPLLARQMDLRENGHVRGQPTLIRQINTGLCQLFLRV